MPPPEPSPGSRVGIIGMSADAWYDAYLRIWQVVFQRLRCRQGRFQAAKLRSIGACVDAWSFSNLAGHGHLPKIDPPSGSGLGIVGLSVDASECWFTCPVSHVAVRLIDSVMFERTDICGTGTGTSARLARECAGHWLNWANVAVLCVIH